MFPLQSGSGFSQFTNREVAFQALLASAHARQRVRGSITSLDISCRLLLLPLFVRYEANMKPLTVP